MPGNYVDILAAYFQQQDQIRMLNHQIQTQQQLQQLPLQLNSIDPIFNQLRKPHAQVQVKTDLSGFKSGYDDLYESNEKHHHHEQSPCQ